MYNVLDVCRYVINYSNDKDYGISNLKLQKEQFPVLIDRLIILQEIIQRKSKELFQKKKHLFWIYQL